MQETRVGSLGQEDPLEKGKATPVFWRIVWRQKSLQNYLENPMDRGALHATVHAVKESDMTE